MSSITVQVLDIDGAKKMLAEAPAKMRAVLQTALKASAILTQGIEKVEAPVDRGYLRGSVDMRAEGSDAVIVWPRANYALNVQTGTGIYGPNHSRIYPKTAKVLAWRSGGKMVFARSIKGQRPNPFVDRTREQAEPQVVETFKSAVDNVINNHG